MCAVKQHVKRARRPLGLAVASTRMKFCVEFPRTSAAPALPLRRLRPIRAGSSHDFSAADFKVADLQVADPIST